MKGNEEKPIEKKEKIGKKTKIIFIILILVFAILLRYVFMMKLNHCENEKCFFDSLKDCKKIYFVKEDPEYSWSYTILREASNNSCEIKVKLLTNNQGSADSKILQNKEMVCIIPKRGMNFPEKDISKCSGVLKENLQDLIIQKMYDYLLTNVQEINTSFFEPLYG